MGLSKAYDKLTENPEFSDGLHLPNGTDSDITGVDGTRLIFYDKGVLTYNEDGNASFLAQSDGTQMRAYDGTPVRISDQEGDFDAVTYNTSASAPGTLELTGANLRFENSALTADREIRTTIAPRLDKYVQNIVTRSHGTGDPEAFIMLFRTSVSEAFASGTLSGYRDNGDSNAQLHVNVSMTESGGITGSVKGNITGNSYEFIELVRVTYDGQEYVAVHLYGGGNGSNMTGGWSYEGVASDGEQALFLRDTESHGAQLGTPTPVDSPIGEQPFFTSSTGNVDRPALQLGLSGQGIYSDGSELIGVDSAGNTTQLT